MNTLSFFLARVNRDLRRLHLTSTREACPRCVWKYDPKMEVCQRCTRSKRAGQVPETIPEEPERCEICGEVIPPEYEIIGIEHQGEPERAGSVYYFAGYDCPACGYHAEV